MSRLSILTVILGILIISDSHSQIKKTSCRTHEPMLFLDQNEKFEIESTMDTNGCLYSIRSGGLSGGSSPVLIVIEKTVIMKQPDNGNLKKETETSYFYEPRNGFKGKDNFVIYICGHKANRSGCARWSYNVTVR